VLAAFVGLGRVDGNQNPLQNGSEGVFWGHIRKPNHSASRPSSSFCTCVCSPTAPHRCLLGVPARLGTIIRSPYHDSTPSKSWFLGLDVRSHPTEKVTRFCVHHRARSPHLRKQTGAFHGLSGGRSG